MTMTRIFALCVFFFCILITRAVEEDYDPTIPPNSSIVYNRLFVAACLSHRTHAVSRLIQLVQKKAKKIDEDDNDKNLKTSTT